MENFAGFQFFLGEEGVCAELAAGGPVADCVCGMGLNQIHGRIGIVLFGFAYFFTRLCKDKTAYHNVFPGNFSSVVKAFYNGIKCPGANDIVGLAPHSHGEDFI